MRLFPLWGGGERLPLTIRSQLNNVTIITELTVGTNMSIVPVIPGTIFTKTKMYAKYTYAPIQDNLTFEECNMWTLAGKKEVISKYNTRFNAEQSALS